MTDALNAAWARLHTTICWMTRRRVDEGSRPDDDLCAENNRWTWKNVPNATTIYSNRHPPYIHDTHTTFSKDTIPMSPRTKLASAPKVVFPARAILTGTGTRPRDSLHSSLRRTPHDDTKHRTHTTRNDAREGMWQMHLQQRRREDLGRGRAKTALAAAPITKHSGHKGNAEPARYNDVFPSGIASSNDSARGDSTACRVSVA